MMNNFAQSAFHKLITRENPANFGLSDTTADDLCHSK